MQTNESDLYIPLRNYLEERNYSVYAEVRECDIAAVRNNNLTIIEIKTRLSMKLIIQGTERQRLSDSVYIAVPARNGKYTSMKKQLVIRLLKRLGLGLIVIHLDRGNDIEIILNPSPPTPPSVNTKKRKKLIREIGGRFRDFNTAGSVSSIETITAYRLKAVKIAVILEKEGPLSPAALKKKGAPEETGTILYNNYYKWFSKIKRGVYTLSESGKNGLDDYREAAEYFRNNLKYL